MCWHNTSPLVLPLKECGKHAVITDSGRLYLLGGQMGNAVHYNYCELYKLIANTVAPSLSWRATLMWRRLEDTPITDCVIMGGRSHGTNGLSILSTVLQLSYSNATDECQHIGDLVYSRTACMAVALDYSTVLVIGGTVYYGEQIDWFKFSASSELVDAN